MARAFGTRLSVAGCQFSVFGSDVADFFAKEKTGKEASCSRTEKTTSAGTDLSYNQPMMALPANQAIPKPVPKTPKAVLRFSDGITPMVKTKRKARLAICIFDAE
jgi:hypothetical protein